ncbi:RIKEN cDNA E330013P04 [Mus musculus]|nr:RIKEN cDNA E330013P04 [Mus musculus]
MHTVSQKPCVLGSNQDVIGQRNGFFLDPCELNCCGTGDTRACRVVVTSKPSSLLPV